MQLNFRQTELIVNTSQNFAKSVNRKNGQDSNRWWGSAALFKMYAYPKFHGSSTLSFWEKDLNAKTWQNFAKSVNCKKEAKAQY